MKTKFSLSKLFDNNKFLQIFALLISVALYIAIAMTDNENRTFTIRDVPVTLDAQQTASLSTLGLYIVDEIDYTVDITVSGPPTVVGQLKADDLRLATTARVPSQLAAGTTDLRVISALSDSRTIPFTIESYSPATISVQLDFRRTKQFDIKAISNGLSTPPNYINQGERAIPEKVSVSGPEAEIAKIASAEIVLELDEPLYETLAQTLTIQLKDAQGEIIDPQEHYLRIEPQEAQLVITINKETGLPLEVGFTNPPRGFLEEELREYMQMSTDYIMVYGPPDEIDARNTVMLGYIDIRDLRPGRTTTTFLLSSQVLGENIKSKENIAEVVVSFDDTNWDTATFNVKDIQLVNEPASYEVEIVTTNLGEIEFAGEKSILETMTASDIVAEIDLGERKLTPGQSNYPVKISAPGKGLVWAVGDEHSVIIRVTEIE